MSTLPHGDATPVPTRVSEAPSSTDLARDPAPFINREISWLEFNVRVLAEAENPATPLYERLKFLGIVAANLDEFFMVRVAGLKQQIHGDLAELPPDGRTPSEQLAAISLRAHQLIDSCYRVWGETIKPGLAREGVVLVKPEELEAKELEILDRQFRSDIFPVLTPITIDPNHPFPHLKNKSINLGVMFSRGEGEQHGFGVVQVPVVLNRVMRVQLPGTRIACVLLEDVIARHVSELFPSYRLRGCYAFRVTRNWDLEIDEEEGEDLLQTIQQELRKRDRGNAVRVEISGATTPGSLNRLCRALKLQPEEDVYRISPLDIHRAGDEEEIVGLVATCDYAENLGEDRVARVQRMGVFDRLGEVLGTGEARESAFGDQRDDEEHPHPVGEDARSLACHLQIDHESGFVGCDRLGGSPAQKQQKGASHVRLDRLAACDPSLGVVEPASEDELFDEDSMLGVGQLGLRFEHRERLLCGIEGGGRGLDDARERVTAEIGRQLRDPGTVEGIAQVVEHVARERADESARGVPSPGIELDPHLAHREGSCREGLVRIQPSGPQRARDRRHALEASILHDGQRGMVHQPRRHGEISLPGEDTALLQAVQDREDVVIPGRTTADPHADLANTPGEEADRLAVVEHREELDDGALARLQRREELDRFSGGAWAVVGRGLR